MGVHTGNHRRLTRCPVSSFGFGPHYRLPAFWLPGPGRRESNVYGVAQTRTRLLGRQMFRTPVCKRTRHLDFPPKPCSNSIFKPQPAENGCARQWTGLHSRSGSKLDPRTHTCARFEEEGEEKWEPNYNCRLLPSGRPTPLFHSPATLNL